MYTLCTLDVHSMYSLCTLYVLSMYSLCTLYVHVLSMYTLCTLYVHSMYSLCVHLLQDEEEVKIVDVHVRFILMRVGNYDQASELGSNCNKTFYSCIAQNSLETGVHVYMQYHDFTFIIIL